MTANPIRTRPMWDDADVRQTEQCRRCWRWGKPRGDILVYAINGDTAEWIMKLCPQCGGSGRVPYGTEPRR